MKREKWKSSWKSDWHWVGGLVAIAIAVMTVMSFGGIASAQQGGIVDSGSALATKALTEENSRLIAAIEKLTQRIEALESRVIASGVNGAGGVAASGEGHRVEKSANPSPGKIHGMQVDPDAVNYEGGTWLHHPQTGQVVFAENIFQRRQGGGGSLVIELIRKNGKPVPLPSVTYGDLTVAQPGGGGGGGRGNGGGGGGGRNAPRALIELPLAGQDGGE
jgi:hypothetical protein